MVFSDTPTRPKPDPLPGILSNTRPDNEKPYPLGTALVVVFFCLKRIECILVRVEITCPMNFNWVPFDRQVCE